MTRSHPPTLLKIAERTLADEDLFAPGDCVVCAVSGGPDSMALLHVLAKLAPRRRVHLAAHAIDHGLRPAAAEEIAIAERMACDLGVAFSSTRLEVRPGSNLMARAREARYAALGNALAAWTEQNGRKEPLVRGFIATGHHADDRAETVLMRLLRGTGPLGLAVLPPRSERLIRPFVRARRSDVIAHVVRHRIPHAHDPTNRDPRFLRTRVRLEAMPLLEQLSPRIVEHLCDIADATCEIQSLDPGIVPGILDGHRLGRAQRTELSRALRNRNHRVRVPLPGGKIATVDLSTRKIMLIEGG